MVVADEKSTLPSWKDVKTVLLTFDRAGLLGLVQDLYAVSRGNQAFLHARLGLGSDPLAPFKASISRWINPDLIGTNAYQSRMPRRRLRTIKGRSGSQTGLAELSIFYCEEAFSFVESCSFDDERYFDALIRMYARSVQCVLNLSAAERCSFAKRLEDLKSRARHVGWGVEEEVKMLWYESDLDEVKANEASLNPCEPLCRKSIAIVFTVLRPP